MANDSLPNANTGAKVDEGVGAPARPQLGPEFRHRMPSNLPKVTPGDVGPIHVEVSPP